GSSDETCLRLVGLARGSVASLPEDMAPVRNRPGRLGATKLGLAALIFPPGRIVAETAAHRPASRFAPPCLSTRRRRRGDVARLPGPEVAQACRLVHLQRHDSPGDAGASLAPARPERHRLLVRLPGDSSLADRARARCCEKGENAHSIPCRAQP